MDESASKGPQNELYSSVWAHNWTRIIFGKPWFWPVFEPFVVPNWPIFKALLALRGAKIAQHGLKMGHSTCLCTLGLRGSKRIFKAKIGLHGLENGPIWDHKWLKNGPKPWFSKNDPSPVVGPNG